MSEFFLCKHPFPIGDGSDTLLEVRDSKHVFLMFPPSELEMLIEIGLDTMKYYRDNGITDEMVESVNRKRKNMARRLSTKRDSVNKGDSLYVIRDTVTGDIKVGRSKNPFERISSIQTDSPHFLVLLKVYEGRGYKETAVHEVLKNNGSHIFGEWFKCGEDTMRIIDETASR